MIEGHLLWAIFLALVLILLLLDMTILKRSSGPVSTRKAIVLSAFWISVGLAFSIVIYFAMGPDPALEYLAAYAVEKSMSVDNLFVFILVFSHFNIPEDHYQHKALLYGIISALFFRGIFILAGIELLTRFHFVMYIFGAVLIYTAFKTVTKEPTTHKSNRAISLISKHISSSSELDGDRFFTIENGVRMATPMLLCVLAIEFVDIIFALDSIPAVLAISTDAFIVYSSNIFAILGLHSLYFLIRDSLHSLAYLKYGLGLILAFVGMKMLLSEFLHLSTVASVSFIALVLLSTVGISILSRKKNVLP